VSENSFPSRIGGAQDKVIVVYRLAESIQIRCLFKWQPVT
jgi:hypothetical protein